MNQQRSAGAPVPAEETTSECEPSLDVRGDGVLKVDAKRRVGTLSTGGSKPGQLLDVSMTPAEEDTKAEPGEV